MMIETAIGVIAVVALGVAGVIIFFGGFCICRALDKMDDKLLEDSKPKDEARGHEK